MVLVGCKPKGRYTEQHDVFFGIGSQLCDLVPQLKEFWPEAADKLHIDGWREVKVVNGYQVSIVDKTSQENPAQLFFINLGGYKPNELEEYHYKMLVVAGDKGEAIQASKQTAFYKHTGFKGATSHVDDKYGIDVDDMFAIPDILSASLKEKFSVQISRLGTEVKEDEVHLGYLTMERLEEGRL